MIAESTESLAKSPPVRKKPASGRITPDDAQAICRMIARGHSESGACALYGKFTANAWFSWKSRGKNTARFNNILARIRETRVSWCLDEIERAATGDKAAGVRHDWRAADRLLGITEPRLAVQQAGVTTTNNVLAIGGDAGQVAKLIAMFAGQVRGQIQDKPEPAKLPPPAQDDKPVDV